MCSTKTSPNNSKKMKLMFFPEIDAGSRGAQNYTEDGLVRVRYTARFVREVLAADCGADKPGTVYTHVPGVRQPAAL